MRLETRKRGAALTDSQRQMAADWYDHARKCAVYHCRRMTSKCVFTVDDVAGAGAIKAVKSWHAPLRMEAVLNVAVQRAWVDHVRAASQSRRRFPPPRFVRLDTRPAVNRLGELMRDPAIAVVADELPPGALMEFEEEVLHLSARLIPREREAVRMRYLHAECDTNTKIGERLGRTESRAHQILRQAHANLRASLAS